MGTDQPGNERERGGMRIRIGKSCLQSDFPPLKVVRAVKRIERLAKAGKEATTTQDWADVATLHEWLEEQHQKYGGIKPMEET